MTRAQGIFLPKRLWKISVNDSSAASTPLQTEVLAVNWLTALELGRRALGETEGMPRGASCTVSPTGGVTVFDPNARRTYVLAPEDVSRSEPDTKPRRPPTLTGTPRPMPAPPLEKGVPPSAVLSIPLSAQEPTKGPKAKRVSRRTMAYGGPKANIPSPSAKKRNRQTVVYGGNQPTAGTTEPSPAEPPRGEKKRGSRSDDPHRRKKHTMTYSMDDLNVGLVSPPGSGPDGPTPQMVTEASLGKVLYQRDEDPSETNPLTYRERVLLVPKGTTFSQCKALLLEQQRLLVAEIGEGVQGRYFNLAVFDTAFTGTPTTPPLATLEWRDWHDYEPRVVAGEPVNTKMGEDRNTDSPSTDQDLRLAKAFEASHDLFFLGTPVEGISFAVRLLAEIIPSEAMAGCLYDINSDELRFVAAVGTSSEFVQGTSVNRGVGLTGRASLDGQVVRLREGSVPEDYDADVDGREGMEITSAMYVPMSTEGRFFGVLQFQNRKGGTSFGAGDEEVARYVAQQLALFLSDCKRRI